MCHKNCNYSITVITEKVKRLFVNTLLTHIWRPYIELQCVSLHLRRGRPVDKGAFPAQSNSRHFRSRFGWCRIGGAAWRIFTGCGRYREGDVVRSSVLRAVALMRAASLSHAVVGAAPTALCGGNHRYTSVQETAPGDGSRSHPGAVVCLL